MDALLLSGPPPPEGATGEAGVHEVVAAQHEVVDHVEVGEQAEDLEGAGHAQAHDRGRAAAHDLGALHADRADFRGTAPGRRMTLGDRDESLALVEANGSIVSHGHVQAHRPKAGLQGLLDHPPKQCGADPLAPALGGDGQ